MEYEDYRDDILDSVQNENKEVYGIISGERFILTGASKGSVITVQLSSDDRHRLKKVARIPFDWLDDIDVVTE